MYLLPALYPMTALGQVEGVAQLLSSAAYRQDSTLQEVIPFGEALGVISPTVSTHFFLDIRVAHEGSNAEAKVAQKDIFILVTQETTPARFKEMTTALRERPPSPFLFRHSHEAMLNEVRRVLSLSPERVLGIYRDIQADKLPEADFSPEELGIFSADQLNVVLRKLFEAIILLKAKTEQEGMEALTPGDIGEIRRLKKPCRAAIEGAEILLRDFSCLKKEGPEKPLPTPMQQLIFILRFVRELFTWMEKHDFTG